MSKKLLLDTNILLDMGISQRPEWAAATILLDEIVYGKAEGFIAASSLKDVYYILSKYTDEPKARKFVLALLDLFTPVAVGASICRIAALSDEPDFEDGLIRACAENVPVDFVISRDKTAFKHSSIKRLSAREYVDLFCDVEETELLDSE